MWFRSIVIVKRWLRWGRRDGCRSRDRLDLNGSIVLLLLSLLTLGSGLLKKRKPLSRRADVGLNHLRLWFGLWFGGNLLLWFRLRLSTDFNRSWRGCCNSLLLGLQPCIGGLGPSKSLVFLADRLLRRRGLWLCLLLLDRFTRLWSSRGLRFDIRRLLRRAFRLTLPLKPVEHHQADAVDAES